MWRSLAAQAICNRQVGGSNPSTGTIEIRIYAEPLTSTCARMDRARNHHPQIEDSALMLVYVAPRDFWREKE